MASAFSRILLAYDESDGSRMALRYASGLAGSGATLTVMHALKESNFIASAAWPAASLRSTPNRATTPLTSGAILSESRFVRLAALERSRV
jgi:hypothetical protein